MLPRRLALPDGYDRIVAFEIHGDRVESLDRRVVVREADSVDAPDQAIRVPMRPDDKDGVHQHLRDPSVASSITEADLRFGAEHVRRAEQADNARVEFRASVDASRQHVGRQACVEPYCSCQGADRVAPQGNGYVRVVET